MSLLPPKPEGVSRATMRWPEDPPARHLLFDSGGLWKVAGLTAAFQLSHFQAQMQLAQPPEPIVARPRHALQGENQRTSSPFAPGKLP